MATRHLYECEDVVASLLTWIFEGNTRSAIAAGRELIHSGEQDLLKKTLQFAALLQYPTFNLFEIQDSETMLSILLEQGAQPFPSFIQNDLEPPTNGTKPLPPSWSILPKGWNEQQASKLWYAVKEALSKNNLKRAAYLTGVIKDIVVLESFLKSMDISSNYLSLLRTWGSSMMQRTALHCLASLLPRPPVASGSPLRLSNLKVPLTGIRGRIGGREGRIFTISASALAFWGLKSKPVSRLKDEPRLVFEDDACEYWVQLCKKYGVTNFRNASEEFYEVGFPDDIPDEWPNEERAKSHDLTLPVIASKSDWIMGFKLLWV